MTARYCSECGTRLISATSGGRPREQCPACGFIAYRNPTPVAMAVIEHEGRLVLIRRRDPPLAGYWAPPAGYVEIGESVPQAAVREAGEECGLKIVLDALTGVHSQADVAVLIVAYRARSIGGHLKAGDDAAEVGLFVRGQLPVQPPPHNGNATDRWLYQVIRDLTAPWSAPA